MLNNDKDSLLKFDCVWKTLSRNYVVSYMIRYSCNACDLQMTA